MPFHFDNLLSIRTLVPAMALAAFTAVPVTAAESDAGQQPQEELPQRAQTDAVIGYIVALEPTQRRILLSTEEDIQNVPSTRDELLNEENREKAEALTVPQDSRVILDDSQSDFNQLRPGDQVIIYRDSPAGQQAGQVRQIRAFRSQEMPEAVLLEQQQKQQGQQHQGKSQDQHSRSKGSMQHDKEQSESHSKQWEQEDNMVQPGERDDGLPDNASELENEEDEVEIEY